MITWIIDHVITLVIGGAAGLLVGVNNPTTGAVAKKLAKQAQDAAAAGVNKLK